MITDSAKKMFTLKIDMNIDEILTEKKILIILLKNPCVIDTILIQDSLTVYGKKYITNKIIEMTKMYYPEYKLKITSGTITKLLQIKEESDDFLFLFTNIINFCVWNFLQVFTYVHLYYLVLQIWMDSPQNIISNNFRKKLIIIGFNGDPPQSIFEQIKININDWFINIGKNSDITELIDWLCLLDNTGQLSHNKILYEKTLKKPTKKMKLSQRLHNMTNEEYEIQQHNAKKNGLCKFVREGKICPHDTKCIFYHGKLEDTYGVQLCRLKTSCTRLNMGNCKFIHEPNDEQICKALTFYKLLKRDNTGFTMNLSNVWYVDKQCYTNPFVILKKDKIYSEHAHYSIPVCSYTAKDEFNIENFCGKPIHFMSREGCFYCCHKHMNISEPDCHFVVKQNILDKIFSRLTY